MEPTSSCRHTTDLALQYLTYQEDAGRRKMKFSWKLCLSPKHKRLLLLKVLLSILFLAIASHFFFNNNEISPILETHLPQNGVAFSPPEIPSVPHPDFHKRSQVDAKSCDLFTGDWIPNPSGPIYNNESCRFIEGHQNCMKNGRPDREYLYWTWSPRECKLPRFNPERFLAMMRNKAWALIGDSISRNHVQSLLCMLSPVDLPVEVYHDEAFKSRRWHFPSYNFALSVIWSPFLVEAAIFEDINGVSSAEVELYLDKLDKNWTEEFRKWDYLIISSGKWFVKSAIYHERGKVIGCHECPKRNLTELGSAFAYRKALQRAMNFIVKSEHKGTILFRTSTPDHFENGEWSTGGTCARTLPVKEGEMELKNFTRLARDIEIEEFNKAALKASKKGVDLRLLDLTPLSMLRPDGHPGPYRQFQPYAQDKDAKVQNDCLHWCLPGPIDSWNDVIMEMVVNG